MNSRLASLQPYPFQRLAQLIHGLTPPAGKAPIRLSMGEPQHAAPDFVLEALKVNLAGLSNYPTTKGSAELRQSICAWATRRFTLDKIALDPERHVLPVAGTREALFSIAQAVIDRRVNSQRPSVVMPNPFYQIYEGAALLAGAKPYFMNAVEENGYRTDFAQVPEEIWQKVPLVYICSPGNPTGAVLARADLAGLIELAHKYNFIIASDECYSEIYFDEAKPPVGLLQVANDLGISDYQHCLVFHSLSKRSSLPGLRSGFVAGDGAVLEQYHQYRTYHGCALPPPTQAASQAAWNDETHVRTNRALYRSKFDAVLKILKPVLDVKKPEAGFYLWPRLPQDDETFARELYARENVLVLPGSYLSRATEGGNPGKNRVRMALVPPLAECIEAAQRVRNYVESLK
ncbi:succinyldiaminopimelate transaminase [Sulfuricaulis sp.]|jgi:N-succinyldiaminopimelate aminotransferase|uniref:succinyldiaminopimelate transaminase n=1 Tax=Sulfuricaulis sp. TaxID=2003553 RepID=UPI00355A7CEC